jgi:hypothetical protein
MALYVKYTLKMDGKKYLKLFKMACILFAFIIYCVILWDEVGESGTPEVAGVPVLRAR